MKIMYLTDVGFDTANGNNHLIVSMLSAFLDEGHSVYLVQSHTTGKYSDIPKELEGRANFYVDTIVRPVIAKENFIKRYLSSIRYEFIAKHKWKKHINDIDVVILQSHYTAVYSAFLLKAYHKKIVFSIFDIFPGEAYTNGNIKSKLVYDFFKFIQTYLYRKCDEFFTLTTDTRRTLISLGVEQRKIAVIPNWFNDKEIREVPYEENTFFNEFNMTAQKHYVQYAGSISVSYDFDLIVNIAEALSYREDIVFQIVGEGLKLDGMKSLAQKKNLNNIQFIPWQSIERLSEVYSACSIQIISLRKDVIRNSYPSKILPLMACGRIPVISVEDSDFYKTINDQKIGIATPLGDKEKMIESIIYLADNPMRKSEMQRNAKKFAYENYTAKVNTQKMMEELAKFQNGEEKDE